MVLLSGARIPQPDPYAYAPLQKGLAYDFFRFVSRPLSVRGILEHIGEPAQPPPIAPARGPPAWEEEAEPLPLLDSLAQPESDFQFDQTVNW